MLHVYRVANNSQESNKEGEGNEGETADKDSNESPDPPASPKKTPLVTKSTCTTT